MKKFAIALAMALFALGAAFVLNVPAQAYPDVQASVRASDYDLVSGQEFTVVASSSTECAWDLDWNGSSRAVRGTQFQTTFVAPEVTTTTSDELSAVCRIDLPKSSSARAAASTVIEPENLVFTIRPAATSVNNGATLAGTGGPDRLVLLSGVALLFAGAGVAMVARRRAEQAELASARF